MEPSMPGEKQAAETSDEAFAELHGIFQCMGLGGGGGEDEERARSRERRQQRLHPFHPVPCEPAWFCQGRATPAETLATLRREGPKHGWRDVQHLLDWLYWRREYQGCLDLCQALHAYHRAQQRPKGPAHLAEVEETAARCCKRLGLPGPAMRWLQPADAGAGAGEGKPALAFLLGQLHRLQGQPAPALAAFVQYLHHRTQDYQAWKAVAAVFLDAIPDARAAPSMETAKACLHWAGRAHHLACALFARVLREEDGGPEQGEVARLARAREQAAQEAFTALLQERGWQHPLDVVVVADLEVEASLLAAHRKTLTPIFGEVELLFIQSQFLLPA